MPTSSAGLKLRREALITRAQFEREALRDATEDLQIASDRIVRVASVGVGLARRYWLPVALLVAGSMFKRTRPLLRMARLGLVAWQTVRLVRAARR